MKIISGAVFVLILLFLKTLNPTAIASPNPGSALGAGLVIKVPQHHSSIQAAIDQAKDGDIILVAPNTYYENILINDKNITLRSDGDGDPTTYDIQPQDTHLDGGGTARVVTILQTTDAVLDGFTITNGLDETTQSQGNFGGGGVYLQGGTAVIKNNVIAGNSAEYGGGFGACSFAYPVLINNMIHNNTAEWYGGGVHLYQSSAWIWNNLFILNEADWHGGGICIQANNTSTEINIYYCTFYDNDGGLSGGALKQIGSTSFEKFEIVSSISWANHSTATPDWDFACQQSPTVKCCDTECGVYSGIGNISEDPLFMNVYQGDFTLQQEPLQPVTSPCVDTAFMDSQHIFKYFPGGSTRTDFVGDVGKGVYREDTQEYTFGEGYDMGFHYPAKYWDSNKWHWRPNPGPPPYTKKPWFSLWFDDCLLSGGVGGKKGFHDTTETIYFYKEQAPPQNPPFLLNDTSCWMQAAFNALYHERSFLVSNHLYFYDWYRNQPYEFRNLSHDYMTYGAAKTPRLKPWPNPEPPNEEYWWQNGYFDTAFTWDDGGWPDWVFTHKCQIDYIQFDRIQTMSASTMSWGDSDPIAWCRKQLDRGHPVCIAIFQTDTPGGGPVPAPFGIPPSPTINNRDPWELSHAITLWELDEFNETVVISDSDDLSWEFDPGFTAQYDPWGVRTLSYDFNMLTKEWKILDYLSPEYELDPPFTRDVYVTYATCVSPPALRADRCTLSRYQTNPPETVNFDIEAGTRHAGRDYFIVGTFSGITPGIDLESVDTNFCTQHLPINHDAYTDFLVSILGSNSQIWVDFAGQLDSEGNATAQINSIGWGGFPDPRMHYAYVIWDTDNLGDIFYAGISNPVCIEIVD